MAQFPAMTITTKGQALYAKAQTGVQLSFTKMQAGHGELAQGQNPVDLLALIASDFDIAISSIEVDAVNNLAKIQGNQTNTGFLAGVELRELGLFATDPDEGEILYAYANARSQGDYIPPESSGPFSRLYTINAAIGNAADVTAVIPQETYVTVEDFNNHKADNVYQTAGGTATAITLTIGGTLVDGYPINFIPSANNSGSATTINTKPLYKPNTTNAPTLTTGKPVTVVYNQSGDCFFIKASAEGDAVVSNVLAGKTFSNDNDTGLTGTMTNNGSPTFNPSSVDQSIPGGYYSGGTIKTITITAGTNNVYRDQSLSTMYTETSYTKMESLKVNKAGTYRVSFDLRNFNNSGTNYGRIYVNDNPVGTERTKVNSSIFTTYTEDITVNANDSIQLWTKMSGGTGGYYSNLTLGVDTAALLQITQEV